MPSQVLQIIGPAVDLQVRGEGTSLSIFQALDAGDTKLGETPLLGDGIVRTVAMSGADGLRRGLVANLRGDLITVPGGDGMLGQELSVLGQPVDGKGPVNVENQHTCGKNSPNIPGRSTNPAIFETGIKVVDAHTLPIQGGKIGLFDGAGVGKTVFTLELIRDIARAHTGLSVFGAAWNGTSEGTYWDGSAGNSTSGNGDLPAIQGTTGQVSELPFEAVCRLFVEEILYGPIGEAIVETNLSEAEVISLSGQTNGPPGALYAEHFRDAVQQDVLLFIDNIFRFGQAGSKIMALWGQTLAAEYQRSLETEMGSFPERNSSTRYGSITSIQAVYVPADDMTDPAPADTFIQLDATPGFSKCLAVKAIHRATGGIYATTAVLQPWIVGDEHYACAQCVQGILQILGLDELSEEDRSPSRACRMVLPPKPALLWKILNGAMDNVNEQVIVWPWKAILLPEDSPTAMAIIARLQARWKLRGSCGEAVFFCKKWIADCPACDWSPLQCFGSGHCRFVD